MDDRKVNSISDAARLIQSTALFSSCRNEQLDIIASYSDFRVFRDGELVFTKGAHGDTLYIVDSGEVAIRRTDDEGLSLILARFLPGDSFGELDMFTGDTRTADAIAVNECRLLMFPRANISFKEILERHPAVSAGLLNTFLVQISSRIRGVNALVGENSPLVRELKRQVYVDKLTGLNNKTLFEETLEKLLKEGNTDTGLLMYKPGNFKIINDSYGHDAGDAALKLIASSLGDFLEDRDMLFRYMGNENAIILENADRRKARELAEKIREFLENLSFEKVLGTDEFRLSVSIGIGLASKHRPLIELVHPLPLAGRALGGHRILFPEDLSVS